MKQTLKIAAVAAGVLLLAGCGQKAAQKSSTDAGANNAPPQTEQKNTVSDVITSMKDAMASGKMMRCTYTVADKNGGAITSTMFVDGKKYAGTTTVAGKAQHMIFDGDAMYAWSEGQKTGLKMTTACSQELAANAPKPASSANQNVPTTPTDPEKTFDNVTDVKCEPSSSADFSIPTDVTFSDQCEMMKNLQKNIPNLPSGVPTSMPGGAPQL